MSLLFIYLVVFFFGFVIFSLVWIVLFTQTLTSVLLLPPFVMSMPSVRILADLIAAPARLVTMVTAKLVQTNPYKYK